MCERHRQKQGAVSNGQKANGAELGLLGEFMQPAPKSFSPRSTSITTSGLFNFLGCFVCFGLVLVLQSLLQVSEESSSPLLHLHRCTTGPCATGHFRFCSDTSASVSASLLPVPPCCSAACSSVWVIACQEGRTQAGRAHRAAPTLPLKM